MNALAFEPIYRQLPPAERAFVDDFVTRIEKASELSGRGMWEVLGEYQPTDREAAVLRLGNVRAAISDRVRDLVEAQNISARRIVKEIAAIAFSSIDHFRMNAASLYDSDFELENATPEQRAAVKEIQIEESARTGKIKTTIKLHDKLGALRMLGQIQGLFNSDGDPINPDKWAENGAVVPLDSTAQDVQMQYARLIDGE